jgi:hypothetical protein
MTVIAQAAGDGESRRAEPRAAATPAPRPDERAFRYSPVTCAACSAVALAAKFSIQHTSVQWDAAAVRQCAEFARRVEMGEPSPLVERCEAMRASIETATRQGRLPVAPP